ncbi:MAG: hypothetical protein US03_C0007G0060 [candidate division TM6 bacterium GW2011_GWF2_36_131]|nr:MAG: hypothetical protein US03_C0007G0060 [candidate division TM6 bacterium GW2011_GWF2_36_131]KKQ19556.1 MAG: hypothetical protein US32_C0007G0009 [candidate division TM6 bacterium GW2011_GWA2_36_9]
MEYNMLLWLPRRLNKRHLFIFQLVCLTFFLHCLVLVTYFFYARPPIMTIKMDMSLVDLSRPITVVPFVKRTGQLTKLVEGKTGKKSNQNNVKNAATPLKVAQINKKAAVIKKEKKPVRNIFKKEPASKNMVLPVKSEEKKEIKKQEVEQKIVPVVPEEKKEEGISPSQIDETISDEPIVLGQEEFEALQIYQEVHTELSRYWHPPAGLHPKKSTILLLHIGEKGEVLQTEVEQSSGVLVYDIAARMAVEKALFPEKLWNQLMRLHF